MAVEQTVGDDVPGHAAASARFGTLRRWWIRRQLPAADPELTPSEWQVLNRRYVAAGGSTEELEALIEREVSES